MSSPYRFRASAALTRQWQHFRFSEADGIATVTLDRPEKLNPLTFESYADLRDLLAELPHHRDVRVLVIRGEGRGFCGGGDVNEIIGELIKMEPRDLMRFTKMTGDVIRAMRECPIPIITRDARHRGRGWRGRRAGLGLPRRGHVRPVRLPVHQGRAVRRRHGRGLPAAQGGRPGPGDRTADARRHHRLRRPPTATAWSPGWCPTTSSTAAVADLATRAGRWARRWRCAQTKSLLTRELDMPMSRHGAGRDDPGTADDQPGPRRVPRRIQRAPATTLGRAAETQDGHPVAGAPCRRCASAGTAAGRISSSRGFGPSAPAGLRPPSARLPRLRPPRARPGVALLGGGVQRPVRVVEVRPAEQRTGRRGRPAGSS